MSRREYGQACSVADALDRVGERWSLLIVRELLLGPLRFSQLARSVGGAPTDVLTKRLRDLERDGIVRRRELGPPASGVVYELTELGRGLERLLVELGRWGLNFYDAEAAEGIPPASLPNSLRVILQPPADASLTVQLHSEGHASWLRIANGWSEAGRGEVAAPDLTLSGAPGDVIAALVGANPDAEDVEIEGDPAALEALRAMVALPERLREEAEGLAQERPAATARTA
jgi:DNA-binding HxlR family transcriptional regulator